MKKGFIIVLLSFIIIGIKAQIPDSIANESSILPGIKAQIPYSVKKEPLYVLDGSVISSDYFVTLNPEDIYELEVVNSETSIKNAVDIYGDEAKHGVIFINSKQYVGRNWLKIFSKFCQNKELSVFLASQDIDYRKFRVVINGEKLKLDFFDKLDLDEKDIKEVKVERRLWVKNNYVIKIKTK